MDAADLMFAGIARQAELVAGGEVSSRELVQTALDRIAQLDPALNAFRVVLAEEALAAADAADARRARGESAPLLGVPVAVKDDNAVAGQKRMMGTDAVETSQRADGEAVARLRRAGAVVVGLTHLPDLRILPVTESPS